MGLKTILTSKKNKKARNAITNVSLEGFSKIIKEFEKLSYKGYVRKRPKHKPTDSYFYLSRNIAKCTIRADVFNLHVGLVITETTGKQQIPILHIIDSDKSK